MPPFTQPTAGAVQLRPLHTETQPWGVVVRVATSELAKLTISDGEYETARARTIGRLIALRVGDRWGLLDPAPEAAKRALAEEDTFLLLGASKAGDRYVDDDEGVVVVRHDSILANTLADCDD